MSDSSDVAASTWQDAAAIVAIQLVKEKDANRSLRADLEHVTHSLLAVSACACVLFVLAIVGWLT